MKKIIFLVIISFLIVFPAQVRAETYLHENIIQAVNFLKSVKKESISPFTYIAIACANENESAGAGAKRACENLEESLESGDTNNYSVLTILTVSAKGDPYCCNGKNLVQILQNAQLESGKFADSIITGGEELVSVHAWAIIALTCAGAKPKEPEKAIQWLADRQHSDGSFNWSASDVTTPDVDSTGMALAALGALGQKKDSPAVKKAISYLKSVQEDDGGFESWGIRNSESCSAVIQGLIAVGADPGGSEFKKPGGDPVTALLKYQLPGGCFEHIKGGGGDEMATQQALIALTDVYSERSFIERLPLLNVRSVCENEEKQKEPLRFQIRGDFFCSVNNTGTGKEEFSYLMEKGFLFVPLRDLAVILGIPQENIKWSPVTKSVTITDGVNNLIISLGQTELYINNRQIQMNVTPLIDKGRIYLPFRCLAEALGYDIEWDADNRTVSLGSK